MGPGDASFFKMGIRKRVKSKYILFLMIDTIIFDLGGVLIDWNPRHLYQKIFNTEEEITWFLENVCTPEWNEQQDAGRPFKDRSA